MDKICNSCGALKDLTEYSFRDKKTQTLRARCRTCESESYLKYKEKNLPKLRNDWRKASKKHYEAMPLTKRSLKKYKLTLEEYNLLLISQSYKCAICKSSDRLVIDHNHKTNIVRGLLCNYCNLMLGYSRDNTKTLRDAIRYLNNAE